MSYRMIIAAAAGICILSASQGAAWAQSTGDVVSKYDKDNDKTLDLDEVKAAAAAHFDKLNTDSDSTLESKEVKGVIGSKAFAAADTDHDGSLSKDEYLALVTKLFNRADADHDGKLSASELKSKSGQELKRLID
jgi:Ca2+-binding EF-hand superfamily protein